MLDLSADYSFSLSVCLWFFMENSAKTEEILWVKANMQQLADTMPCI